MTGSVRVPRYADEEIYAAYERLGSGVLVGRELGLSHGYVSLRLRTYRREVLGVTAKMPRLSAIPRAQTHAVVSGRDSVDGYPLQRYARGEEVAALAERVTELERLTKMLVRAVRALSQKEAPQ